MALRPAVKLGWSIFFILTLASLGLSYYSYGKQTDLLVRHEENLQNIKGLKEKQAKLAEFQPKTQEELELAKILAEQQGDLWFLEDIEELLGEKYFPTFVLIGPLTQEAKENHIVYSRQMSLNATFPEVELLFMELESKRGFAISGLKLDAGTTTANINENGQQRHHVDFKLSCVKIKESFLTELGLPTVHNDQQIDAQVVSLLMDIPWGEGQKLDLDNEVKDPFIVYVRPVPKQIKTESTSYEPKDLSGQYTLQGIATIGGKKMAIISPDRVLEVGDLLDHKKIAKIEDARIVLKEGRQEYFIKLPGGTEFGLQSNTTSDNDKDQKEPLESNKSDEVNGALENTDKSNNPD
ncbi:MAG: hypothetical protein HZA78_01720 [Candidatus Schekmanbacteria bacterium]|nr:hypothetical protein [Candidatus Schekmanbacteria bacterium]